MPPFSGQSRAARPSSSTSKAAPIHGQRREVALVEHFGEVGIKFWVLLLASFFVKVDYHRTIIKFYDFLLYFIRI